MKARKILYTALPATLLLCASPAVSAQWYLFGEKKSAAAVDTTANTTANTTAIVQPAAVPVFSDTVNALLLLPLGSLAEKPNQNFMDFCNGALLAAKKLGEAGNGIRLRIEDSSIPGWNGWAEALEWSDVAIGPVSYDEMRAAVELCPPGKVLVSPLDPKTAALSKGGKVIQAPSSWTAQIDELADWISKDIRFNHEDSLVFFRDSTDAIQTQQYALECFERKGLRCTVQEASEATPLSAWGTTRFVSIGQRDDVLSIAIRSVAAQAESGSRVCLYTTSKAKSMENADVTSLNKAGVRLATTYFVDYGSRDVNEFILAYRALFNHEPGQFAFCGYDCFHTFVRMCITYGKKWPENINERNWNGLQTDFRFIPDSLAGPVNRGVRRVVYERDLRIKTEKQ